MCGIAGIFTLNPGSGLVDRSELRAIRDHMAARGPDATGEWYSPDGRVALGHRRLSIIDLSSRSSQPMVGSNGRLVITFNGEIYNYRQLKRDLETKGRTFSTESDTEVLLQLYEEKGEAMLHDLRGMYAFAIWDALRQELFLARDPFGIKPLYYSATNHTFRFASQVKALLAGGHIDTAPQPAGHAGFFLWGSVPEPWTLYRGIWSLPAGHSMTIGQDLVARPKPFLRITDVIRGALANPAFGTPDEALEVISAAVGESVRAHRAADVPVGLFLSAGLDSAMIGALLSADGNHPHSLTLLFDEYANTARDEAPLARKLADLFGTKHSTVNVSRAEFEGEREKLLDAMDQPSIDGVNTWFVARAAARQGMKVALSGVGGDELFGGYSSFRDVPRIVRLAAPFSFFPGLGKLFRVLSAPTFAKSTSPKYAGLLQYGTSMGGAYLLSRGLYMDWELPKVLHPDLAHQGWQDLQALLELSETASPWSPRGRGSSNRPSQVGKRALTNEKQRARLGVSALEMSCYMRNQLLRDTDWTGMAHSLEIRVPFVDVTLLNEIAPWISSFPGLTKPQVASSIVPHLPREVLSKPKTGFSVPIHEWLMAGQLAPTSTRGSRGWAKYVYQQFGGDAF